MAIITHTVALAAMVTHIMASKDNSGLNITDVITLSPPSAPASHRQVVDAAYNSFSVEFSYMADFGGNDTYVLVLDYSNSLTLRHAERYC
jgi:hypothetical protein